MTMREEIRGTALDRRIHALQQDLTDESGPSISTMRNYNFAILPYNPADEFELRRKVSQLSAELRSIGWVVHTISLRKLMLKRIRQKAGDRLERFIERERLGAERAPLGGLRELERRIPRWLSGEDGLAADVGAELERLVDEDPDRAERTVVFLGQVAALYPFVRTSALLRYFDGHTHKTPVVLLYPGDKTEEGGLRFMGELDPNMDYRPRIY